MISWIDSMRCHSALPMMPIPKPLAVPFPVESQVETAFLLLTDKEIPVEHQTNLTDLQPYFIL